MAIAAAIAGSPALAVADRPRLSRRIATLDGLRGFLALSVFLHHGLVYRGYLETGEWRGTPGLSEMLGSGAVALFFMVTGYLFWAHLIACRGRPDWMHLYISRVFRIAPLFMLATGTALLATFAAAPGLIVAPTTLLGQITPYALLGFVPLDDVNGFATPLLLAGVVWSLRYEWLFYLALPLLALAARRAAWHLSFSLALLAASLVSLSFGSGPVEDKLVYVSATLFSLGMLSASLHALGLRRTFGWAGSVACLALLVVAVGCFSTAYSRPAMLILGAAFFLVASGCSLFGLLSSRAAIRLGELSYGIYLLHGLALAAVLRPAPIRALVLSSPLWHAALLVATMLVLLLCATLAHVHVERRGVRLGRRAARWAAARRPLIALSPEGLEPR